MTSILSSYSQVSVFRRFVCLVKHNVFLTKKNPFCVLVQCPYQDKFFFLFLWVFFFTRCPKMLSEALHWGVGLNISNPDLIVRLFSHMCTPSHGCYKSHSISILLFFLPFYQSETSLNLCLLILKL